MDTLSHAGWGYLLLRRQGFSLARRGAVAGAAPDLLYFIPLITERIVETGWAGLLPGAARDPAIWRSDGPPLPPDLVEAYYDYYRYTHSLVILGLAIVLTGLWRRRDRLWLTAPYVLHILMDIPTHERYLTPFLFPLSTWTIQGIAWSRPLIFWGNWLALAATFLWLRTRQRAQATGRQASGSGKEAA
ncbi:MAG: hypothetical protein ACRDFA_12090 [bacterium]